MSPRRRSKPLQMSLTAAQIFVQTDDVDTVELVVAEALAEWAAGVGDLGTTEAGTPLPLPERRIVLLPPVGGFIAVIEENGRVDCSLARSLSARTGVLVLAAELEGHFLAAQLETLEADGESESWGVPETSGDDSRMPVYVDAEAELFRRLRARGVPAALIATDWEDMIDTGSPTAHGARILAEAGVTGLDKTILPFGEIRAFDLIQGPRVRPDLWVAGPDGEAQVVEARRLTGEWHTEALLSLAAVEEQQLTRILPTLAWSSETGRLPEIVFRYEGMDDESFFTALEAVRRLRPLLRAWRSTEWLSIAGLEERLREAAERVLPSFEIGRRCDRRLEVRHDQHPNRSFFIDLAGLWQRYLLAPDALSTLLPAVLLECLESVGDEPYDEDRLFPLLLGDDAPELATLAVRPLTDGVWIALGLDSGKAVQPLTRAALAWAEVGFDDALEAAVHRLEVATEENDEFVLYEQPEGMTMSGAFPDVSSAARILSPTVLSHVAQQLGDECFVAVPTRDIFLAAEGTREARGWLEREVARRYLSKDLPLSLMIWSVQNGELVADRPADPAAGEWNPVGPGE